MGRTQQQEESEESTLRRSGRKRKLKRYTDFDYDYHDIEENLIVMRKTPDVRLRTAKQDIPRVQIKDSRIEISKLSATSSSNNKAIKLDFVKVAENSERSCELEKVEESSKRSNMDLSKMNPIDIINMHYEILERRLIQVAHNYLENWRPSRPTFVAPHSFLGGDPGRYCAFESDDAGVRKVVDDMLEVVSYVYK